MFSPKSPARRLECAGAWQSRPNSATSCRRSRMFPWPGLKLERRKNLKRLRGDVGEGAEKLLLLISAARGWKHVSHLKSGLKMTAWALVQGFVIRLREWLPCPCRAAAPRGYEWSRRPADSFPGWRATCAPRPARSH